MRSQEQREVVQKYIHQLLGSIDWVGINVDFSIAEWNLDREFHPRFKWEWNLPIRIREWKIAIRRMETSHSVEIPFPCD